MPLSNEELRLALADGRLYIDPAPTWPDHFDTDAIDLSLGRIIHYLPKGRHYKWDPQEETITQFWKRSGRRFILKPGQVFWLEAGAVALGETFEIIGLPWRRRAKWETRPTLSGEINGRSLRTARAFLGVHVDAAWIHPSSQHHIALELHNRGPIDIVLRFRDRIIQLKCEPVVGKVVPTLSDTNGQISPIGEQRRVNGSNKVVAIGHARHK